MILYKRKASIVHSKFFKVRGEIQTTSAQGCTSGVGIKQLGYYNTRNEMRRLEYKMDKDIGYLVPSYID